MNSKFARRFFNRIVNNFIKVSINFYFKKIFMILTAKFNKKSIINKYIRKSSQRSGLSSVVRQAQV